MRVTIDQAGRIVVPKAVRDRLGLRKNSTLELEEGPEGIVLKPVDQETRLVRRSNGRLMVVGSLPPDYDLTHAVDEMREERIRELGGW